MFRLADGVCLLLFCHALGGFSLGLGNDGRQFIVWVVVHGEECSVALELGKLETISGYAS